MTCNDQMHTALSQCLKEAEIPDGLSIDIATLADLKDVSAGQYSIILIDDAHLLNKGCTSAQEVRDRLQYIMDLCNGSFFFFDEEHVQQMSKPTIPALIKRIALKPEIRFDNWDKMFYETFILSDVFD